MESETALLEGQSEIAEQLSDLRFRTVDEIFVDDAVNAVGRHAIEMRHQRNVIAINPAKLGEAEIGIDVIVLEHREAARSGMAAGIDDFRVRKDEQNKPDLMVICRSFVDEERSSGPAVNLYALQVLFPQPRQGSFIEVRENAG